MVTLAEITGSFLLKVYKTTKRLNVVGIEFIFETIKILTLEIKFIQHKNNNYVWIWLQKWKKDEFYIMKHLLIEHEEPINKNSNF